MSTIKTTISVEEYFRNKDGLKITAEPISYSRISPKFIGLKAARKSIQDKYAVKDGCVGPQGVGLFRNARIFNGGLITTGDGDIVTETIENEKFAAKCKVNFCEDSERILDRAISGEKAGGGNYGHFLIEIVPRIADGTKMCPLDSQIVLSKRSKRFCLPILEAAEIDKSRVYWTGRRPITVRELYWPLRNSFHPLNTSPDAIRTVRKIGENLVGSHKPSRKLFISRRDATTRQLTNDYELFKRLALLGFEWVEPGRMSFFEQVKTFSEAKTVVGVCGASLTNVIFMPPYGKLVMLNPQSSAGFWFWDLCHHARVDFTVIFGKNIDQTITDKDADFKVNIDDVMTSI